MLVDDRRARCPSIERRSEAPPEACGALRVVRCMLEASTWVSTVDISTSDDSIRRPRNGSTSPSRRGRARDAPDPAEAVEQMRIRVPVRANRKLRTVIERVNRDDQLKGWWHVANVNAVARMEINDHSWVHIQIVTNIALKLLRQLTKHGVEPNVVTRLRHNARRRRGGRRADRADALRRHVGAPAGPRGLQPLPRRAEAARAARRDLRGARPDGDRLRGAAGDHQPPLRRRAADARGRHPPRRRRARHGAGPLAHRVRARPRRHPLALGRGDRGGRDLRRRARSRSASRSG